MSSLHRAGMNLLEVTIGLVIFALIMGITYEVLISTRRFVSTAAMADNLSDEGRTIIRSIMDDLGNSAWQLKPGLDTEKLAEAGNINFDRNVAQYYPYIIMQDYASATAADPSAFQLAGNGLPNTSGWYAPFIIPSNQILTPAYLTRLQENLPSSHLKQSRGIIFLRVRYGDRVTDSPLIEHEWLNFNTDPAKMSDYLTPDNLPVVSSMAVTSTGSDVADMPLNWESYREGSNAAAWEETGNVTTIWNGTDLLLGGFRWYCYDLERDPQYGKRLVRRYYEKNNSRLVTEEISTEVDRIVFDTYRTSGDLALNQVRVQIWLSRPSDENPLIPVRHYVEQTIALRSTVDPEYSLRLNDWLGKDSGGFSLVP
ncbi:MAG: prepilin-type N-terminal cleavage/methylation domain-containing protein [Planctomycetota bacterium]|jgi:prepilin-type N-terminal cleavage/methylation domain-containing protein|nr:prepilin-type N-terminal cleavage/methylation domain-containing protein [Planctomycetota bacterium]